MKKVLFVIIDGLGDRPIKELGGKTPLEAAKTPSMDYLAKRGICGLQKMLPDGVYPTSEECHLALFGYDYLKDYPGRGVLEALGAGISLDKNDVAFRIDIGTVDENFVLIDPHAGGVDSIKELTDSLEGIKIGGIKFDIYPTLQHRGVLVIRSPHKLSLNFDYHSSEVSDTDPHKAGPHRKYVEVLKPRPLDGSEEAAFIARILEKYQEKTAKILKNHPFNEKRIKEGKMPCNYVLTRGAGELKEIPSFKEKWGLKAGAVAGAPLYKGIAKYLGMHLVEDPSFNGRVDTNLDGKVKTVLSMLNPDYRLRAAVYSFIYLHIKGADSLAEDFGDYKKKKEFIEKIDKNFEPFLKLKDTVIMITGDHTTACGVKDHVEDPVPFLIYDKLHKDSVQKFGERACEKGSLGLVRGTDLIKKVMSLR
ncbi:MAG: 2,3-bisphosphoglycerate-independent phosphoglycerate mutase [Patescibacteria group bacterium]|nr:2,3-bisphosphoglycerate-independent phosphoglycerate mutase [Patescibacteria group bacterium]MCL5093649.1 2,3-bisphosphoglycerate-independent phosphoglycerate mutase [Patescibacteria group bacterium]